MGLGAKLKKLGQRIDDELHREVEDVQQGLKRVEDEVRREAAQIKSASAKLDDAVLKHLYNPSQMLQDYRHFGHELSHMAKDYNTQDWKKVEAVIVAVAATIVTAGAAGPLAASLLTAMGFEAAAAGGALLTAATGVTGAAMSAGMQAAGQKAIYGDVHVDGASVIAAAIAPSAQLLMGGGAVANAAIRVGVSAAADKLADGHMDTKGKDYLLQMAGEVAGGMYDQSSFSKDISKDMGHLANNIAHQAVVQGTEVALGADEHQAAVRLGAGIAGAVAGAGVDQVLGNNLNLEGRLAQGAFVGLVQGAAGAALSGREFDGVALLDSASRGFASVAISSPDVVGKKGTSAFGYINMQDPGYMEKLNEYLNHQAQLRQQAVSKKMPSPSFESNETMLSLENVITYLQENSKATESIRNQVKEAIASGEIQENEAAKYGQFLVARLLQDTDFQKAATEQRASQVATLTAALPQEEISSGSHLNINQVIHQLPSDVRGYLFETEASAEGSVHYVNESLINSIKDKLQAAFSSGQVGHSDNSVAEYIRNLVEHDAISNVRVSGKNLHGIDQRIVQDQVGEDVSNTLKGVPADVQAYLTSVQVGQNGQYQYANGDILAAVQVELAKHLEDGSVLNTPEAKAAFITSFAENHAEQFGRHEGRDTCGVGNRVAVNKFMDRLEADESGASLNEKDRQFLLEHPAIFSGIESVLSQLEKAKNPYLENGHTAQIVQGLIDRVAAVDVQDAQKGAPESLDESLVQGIRRIQGQVYLNDQDNADVRAYAWARGGSLGQPDKVTSTMADVADEHIQKYGEAEGRKLPLHPNTIHFLQNYIEEHSGKGGESLSGLNSLLKQSGGRVTDAFATIQGYTDALANPNDKASGLDHHDYGYKNHSDLGKRILEMDTEKYRQNNSDVEAYIHARLQASGLEGSNADEMATVWTLAHMDQFGKKEGRDIGLVGSGVIDKLDPNSPKGKFLEEYVSDYLDQYVKSQQKNYVANYIQKYKQDHNGEEPQEVPVPQDFQIPNIDKVIAGAIHGMDSITHVNKDGNVVVQVQADTEVYGNHQIQSLYELNAGQYYNNHKGDRVYADAQWNIVRSAYIDHLQDDSSRSLQEKKQALNDFDQSRVQFYTNLAYDHVGEASDIKSHQREMVLDRNTLDTMAHDKKVFDFYTQHRQATEKNSAEVILNEAEGLTDNYVRTNQWSKEKHQELESVVHDQKDQPKVFQMYESLVADNILHSNKGVETYADSLTDGHDKEVARVERNIVAHQYVHESDLENLDQAREKFMDQKVSDKLSKDSKLAEQVGVELNHYYESHDLMNPDGTVKAGTQTVNASNHLVGVMDAVADVTNPTQARQFTNYGNGFMSEVMHHQVAEYLGKNKDVADYIDANNHALGNLKNSSQDLSQHADDVGAFHMMENSQKEHRETTVSVDNLQMLQKSATAQDYVQTHLHQMGVDEHSANYLNTVQTLAQDYRSSSWAPPAGVNGATAEYLNANPDVAKALATQIEGKSSQEAVSIANNFAYSHWDANVAHVNSDAVHQRSSLHGDMKEIRNGTEGFEAMAASGNLNSNVSQDVHAAVNLPSHPPVPEAVVSSIPPSPHIENVATSSAPTSTHVEELHVQAGSSAAQHYLDENKDVAQYVHDEVNRLGLKGDDAAHKADEIAKFHYEHFVATGAEHRNGGEGFGDGST